MPRTKAPIAKRGAQVKTVLVTGASGRLGRHLCGELLKDGFAVRSLSSKPDGIHTLPIGTIPFVGEINDLNAMKNACSGVHAVYHLAAIVSQRHAAGAQEILRVNAHGTATVLEAAEHEGVDRFIFPSTVDVYGARRRETLTESTPLRPTDMYGHSKMLAERQIRAFGGSLRYTIFRTATIYGEGFEHSFFKIFGALRAGKVYIIGDGQNVLALIHARDAIRALRLALDHTRSPRNVYNLADGARYTQEHLLEMAARALKVPAPTKHVGTTLFRMLGSKAGFSPDEIRFITSNREVDISKIKKELGFRPRMEIREATRALAEEYLRHH